MKLKIKPFGLLLFVIMMATIVSATDEYYLKSGNRLFVNSSDGSVNFTLLFDSDIINDVLIDTNSIYLTTGHDFYSINKTNSSINFKDIIIGSTNLKQTDNYVYVTTYSVVYAVKKSDGSITYSRNYNRLLDSLFTFFGISSITTTSNIKGQISFYDNNNGIVISTGLKPLNPTIYYNGTMTEITAISDISGSATIDIYKGNLTSSPSKVGTITITSTQKYHDVTLSGFTDTSFVNNDNFQFNVTSVSSMTWLNLDIGTVRT